MGGQTFQSCRKSSLLSKSFPGERGIEECPLAVMNRIQLATYRGDYFSATKKCIKRLFVSTVLSQDITILKLSTALSQCDQQGK